jgi:23S rRNA-/tRNA-specific pseudouridylate synthase
VPYIALYNKPIGIHSTIGDPWKRLSLSDVIQQHSLLQQLHPVGRLDADTSGDIIAIIIINKLLISLCIKAYLYFLRMEN